MYLIGPCVPLNGRLIHVQIKAIYTTDQSNLELSLEGFLPVQEVILCSGVSPFEIKEIALWCGELHVAQMLKQLTELKLQKL